MRKALVVGINYYTDLPCLYGCVNDAHKVKNILEQHSDGSANFGVKLLTATNEATAVSRADVKDNVRDLFAGHADIALFYFAGHGSLDTTGGFLCGSDSQRNDDGLSQRWTPSFRQLSGQIKVKSGVIGQAALGCDGAG